MSGRVHLSDEELAAGKKRQREAESKARKERRHRVKARLDMAKDKLMGQYTGMFHELALKYHTKTAELVDEQIKNAKPGEIILPVVQNLALLKAATAFEVRLTDMSSIGMTIEAFTQTLDHMYTSGHDYRTTNALGVVETQAQMKTGVLDSDLIKACKVINRIAHEHNAIRLRTQGSQRPQDLRPPTGWSHAFIGRNTAKGVGVGHKFVYPPDYPEVTLRGRDIPDTDRLSMKEVSGHRISRASWAYLCGKSRDQLLKDFLQNMDVPRKIRVQRLQALTTIFVRLKDEDVTVETVDTALDWHNSGKVYANAWKVAGKEQGPGDGAMTDMAQKRWQNWPDIMVLLNNIRPAIMAQFKPHTVYNNEELLALFLMCLHTCIPPRRVRDWRLMQYMPKKTFKKKMVGGVWKGDFEGAITKGNWIGPLDEKQGGCFVIINEYKTNKTYGPWISDFPPGSMITNMCHAVMHRLKFKPGEFIFASQTDKARAHAPASTRYDKLLQDAFYKLGAMANSLGQRMTGQIPGQGNTELFPERAPTATASDRDARTEAPKSNDYRHSFVSWTRSTGKWKRDTDRTPTQSFMWAIAMAQRVSTADAAYQHTAWGKEGKYKTTGVTYTNLQSHPTTGGWPVIKAGNSRPMSTEFIQNIYKFWGLDGVTLEQSRWGSGNADGTDIMQFVRNVTETTFGPAALRMFVDGRGLTDDQRKDFREALPTDPRKANNADVSQIVEQVSDEEDSGAEDTGVSRKRKMADRLPDMGDSQFAPWNNKNTVMQNGEWGEEFQKEGLGFRPYNKPSGKITRLNVAQWRQIEKKKKVRKGKQPLDY